MPAGPTPWWKKTGNTTTLVGMRCEQCEQKFFPPREICPACSSKALNPIDLPASGHLVTWTVTRVLPEEHEEKEAVLGLTDFGGALVLAKIRGVEGAELEKDFLLSVELESTKIDPCHPKYSFYFVPTEKTGKKDE